MEVLVCLSGPFTGIEYRSEIGSGVFYPFHVPILSPLCFLISAVKDSKWGFKSSSQTAVLSIFPPGLIISHIFFIHSSVVGTQGGSRSTSYYD